MKTLKLEETVDEIHETINPTSRIGMQVSTLLEHYKLWQRVGDEAMSQLAELYKSIGNDMKHEATRARRESLRSL